MLGRVIWSMSKAGAVPMFPLAPRASPLKEVATWAKLTEGHSRKAAKKPIAQGNLEEVVAFISIISCCGEL
jgi:hypothetical protein